MLFNFDRYYFKVGAFFETQCSADVLVQPLHELHTLGYTHDKHSVNNMISELTALPKNIREIKRTIL